MTPAWAPRPAALGRACRGAPDVDASRVDRLGACGVPSHPALATAAGPRHGPCSRAGLLAHGDRQQAETSAALVTVEPLGLPACRGTASWEPRPWLTVGGGEGGAPVGAPEGAIACVPSRFPQRGRPAVGASASGAAAAAKSIMARGGLHGVWGSPHPGRAGLSCVPACGVGPGRAPTPGRPRACQRGVSHASRAVSGAARPGGAQGPHGWVTGAAALGRPTGVRQAVRERGAR